MKNPAHSADYKLVIYVMHGRNDLLHKGFTVIIHV